MTTWLPKPLQGSDLVDLLIYQWGPGVAFGDTIIPVARGDLVDRSIQVEGTFQAGTTVNLQGSNDATTTTNGNYHNLHDPFSNIISITGPGLVQVTEVSAWTKPVISAGTGTESLTITVAIRVSLK